MRQETVWAMKQRVRELLLSRTMWSERAMDDAPIRALIQRLRPETPDVPLIRMGGPHDGGYLVPDDLDGIAACISPGVSDECSFDTDAAARGMDVYMADASVDGPPNGNPRFHFSKLFFDTYNSDSTVTLDDYCAGIAPGADLLLEMDIENAGPTFGKGDIGIPPFLEFTFYRRDRSTFASKPATFPHPLDVANDNRVKDVVLPPIWHPGAA